jgi:hypothetical protein
MNASRPCCVRACVPVRVLDSPSCRLLLLLLLASPEVE